MQIPKSFHASVKELVFTHTGLDLLDHEIANNSIPFSFELRNNASLLKERLASAGFNAKSGGERVVFSSSGLSVTFKQKSPQPIVAIEPESELAKSFFELFSPEKMIESHLSTSLDGFTFAQRSHSYVDRSVLYFKHEAGAEGVKAFLKNLDSKQFPRMPTRRDILVHKTGVQLSARYPGKGSGTKEFLAVTLSRKDDPHLFDKVHAVTPVNSPKPKTIRGTRVSSSTSANSLPGNRTSQLTARRSMRRPK